MNYANRYGYSDIKPYEVIRKVSDKCLVVRPMDAKLADGEKPIFIPGGFAGHCVNQNELKYDIAPNPEAGEIRIRFGKQGWKDANGNKYKVADKPVYFYDYNF